MKIYFSLVGFMILIAGMGCKKDIPENIPIEKKWIVSTVAGDGTASFGNGPALTAKFHFPNDVVVAADGTIYVTDIQNHNIRKIADGQVSTFAGSDLGFENGHGLSAKFRYPFSITMDADGNVYSTEVDDPRIRKINPGADVSTYAGLGEEGFADGNSDTARFREETSIVADGQGNIYVADAQNNRIRKISSNGKVSTVAGNDTAGFREGNGGAARFNFPDGIAIDKLGNLYVADGSNYRIRKITPAGQVSTYAGSDKFGSLDGDIATARFSFPMDMVIDNIGNLYVLDLDRIRKISPEGIVSTIAGGGNGYVDGEGAIAKFNTPGGVGIDARGNIYIADTDNNRIRKISFE